MKKNIKILTVAAMGCLLAGVLIYSGCKKSELDSQGTTSEIAEAKGGNTCTGGNEYSDVLNQRLNVQGTNNSTGETSITNLQTIIIKVPECKFTIDPDGNAMICQSEQSKIANQILRVAREEAKNLCGPGQSKVLAYTVDAIIPPTGAPGEVIEITIIAGALLACAAPAPGPCDLTNTYQWGPGAGNAPPALVQDIEDKLNNPACNTLLPPACPPEGVPVNQNFVTTIVKKCDWGMQSPPPGCQVFNVVIPYQFNQYASMQVTPTMQQQAYVDAITQAQPKPPCSCQGPNAAQIQFYDVQGTIIHQGQLFSDPIERVLAVTYYFRCCGLCL